MRPLKLVHKQAFLLILSFLSLIFGVLDGQYELVMWEFVRVVCRSCIGLG